MIRSIAVLAFCAALLLSLAALADPLKLALPVGHTRMVSLPERVAAIKVEDPSVVQIRRMSGGVSIYGRAQGNTTAVIRTEGGERELRIYVAADSYALPR
ncbi:MAG: pilus assembly protein N-terminal domain-containing protein [Myxococcales bacterium]|nr:pilus assembly protein N-terminal domain-containing protein [Myxococcales bacterium]